MMALFKGLVAIFKRYKKDRLSPTLGDTNEIAHKRFLARFPISSGSGARLIVAFADLPLPTKVTFHAANAPIRFRPLTISERLLLIVPSLVDIFGQT